MARPYTGHFPGWTEPGKRPMIAHGGLFVWDGVQRKPRHIVAHYLVLRRRAFTEHVLRPALLSFTELVGPVFEWAGAGFRPLPHALFWIPTAPPLGPRDGGGSSHIKFAQYWGLVDHGLEIQTATVA